MKLVSFNVNGIRARLHQLETLTKTHQPDVIGVQESKVDDEQFPVEAINALGYQVIYHGQKGHYGVALLSKQTPLGQRKGFPTDSADAQRRVILGSYALHPTDSQDTRRLHVINAYFPQGEGRSHPVKFPAKEKFYADMLSYLETEFSPEDHLVLMGDMNISPEDLDIGIGDDNRKRWLRTGKCSFLPEERQWLEKIKAWGLTDTYRQLHGEDNSKFSWFDYRSKGFDRDPKRGLRIDLIMASAKVQALCTQAEILYDIRGMEKPSDHAPITAILAP